MKVVTVISIIEKVGWRLRFVREVRKVFKKEELSRARTRNGSVIADGGNRRRGKN